jgi:hypothetical protein
VDEPNYNISDHARKEAIRRSIPLEVLQNVLESPDQIVESHNNRAVHQSKIDINGKLYLVRAIVEHTDPLTVVTIYRTSKIEKYWSNES